MDFGAGADTQDSRNFKQALTVFQENGKQKY